MTDKALQTTDKQSVTPMQLLQVAMDKGADLDKLEKLMDMQTRWEEKEAKKAFVAAMSGFRAACPTIARTRKGQSNKYAGLAETADQIKAMLSDFDLSYRWETLQEGKDITVTCIVTHILGHSEATSLTSEADKGGNKNSIQAIGSAVAYLQRYTLYAILGLASREMDDDGKGATIEPVLIVTEDQWQALDILIDEVGADRTKFCTVYKIDCLENLPASQFEHAVKALEKKRKS